MVTIGAHVTKTHRESKEGILSGMWRQCLLGEKTHNVLSISAEILLLSSFEELSRSAKHFFDEDLKCNLTQV